MKHMKSKPDSSALIMDFIANGGKINKCKPQEKKPTKAEVKVVEIEVDFLPPELRNKYFSE